MNVCQVEAIQTESVRLQAGYAGNSMQDIQAHEAEVVNAWRNLHIIVETRRVKLADASDLYRFMQMARDLMLWMDDIMRQMNTQEKPRYVTVYSVYMSLRLCSWLISWIIFSWVEDMGCFEINNLKYMYSKCFHSVLT